MKLLIVDDEKLTREGLVASIDWNSLGITEIYEADDGVNGLREARLHHPDIILCDVRMPRMDGIAMLERIEALFPDIAAIFMSGYSDKEYLKAAIQLKAIHYIDKPIEPKEIQAAVTQAVELRKQQIRQRTAEQAHTSLTAAQLAFQMTVPYSTCKETLDSLCSQFKEYYGTDKFKSITTFIVKLEEAPDTPDALTCIHQELSLFLQAMHLRAIYSQKRNFYVVYHIYGSIPPTSGTLTRIADQLHLLFTSLGEHYIAIGDTVNGISNAYRSYEGAVVLLQNSYFFEPGSVLTEALVKAHAPADLSSIHGISENYIQALSQKDREPVFDALNRLCSTCTQSPNLMPNQIKAVYYELFSALYKSRKINQLLPDFSIENPENVMDIMDSCFSYSLLHNVLVEKTENFFHDLAHSQPENATIYLIRDFIGNHYANPSLSVKDISEFARLSASYVCTFFKNETGVTLNQYLTEFRMEKAKQLLADPRYRISDISAAVGYSDGNYFGKSFRKYTGLSPSEYREKVLNTGNPKN